MSGKNSDSTNQQIKKKVSLEKKNVQKDLEQTELNSPSDNIIVTDEDILTNYNPSKNEDTQENERTDDSLGK